MEKVVVGFSGGLDTTYCVKYLTLEKGLEVHSVIVNTGGFSEEELKKVARAKRRKLVRLSPSALKDLDGEYKQMIHYPLDPQLN